MIDEFCHPTDEAMRLLRSAFDRLRFSMRSYHRILRTARTIADIEGCGEIREDHLLEALSYRMPERFFES